MRPKILILFLSLGVFGCNSNNGTATDKKMKADIQEENLLLQAQATDFKVTIFRQYPSAHCTSGYLAVNGNIICYTLEKPWRDNQRNISSIPSGTYNGILRYDHSDHWRIELLNVPHRTNIQIHVGNTTDDISGCILVGDRLTSDLCSIVGGTSATAYQKLKTAFYGSSNPTSTPNKNISIEITGNTN